MNFNDKGLFMPSKKIDEANAYLDTLLAEIYGKNNIKLTVDLIAEATGAVKVLSSLGLLEKKNISEWDLEKVKEKIK